MLGSLLMSSLPQPSPQDWWQAGVETAPPLNKANSEGTFECPKRAGFLLTWLLSTPS